MTTHFDSLDYAQRLERAGVPEEQAAVHAQALQQGLDGLVCRHHLEMTEHSFQQALERTEERLSSQIALVRIELQAEMQALRADLEAKIQELRSELLEKFDLVRAEQKFMRWAMGLIAALNITVLLKLFNL
ncbi:MAG: hypothetical protein ACXW2U_04545 [Telluria sp.]